MSDFRSRQSFICSLWPSLRAWPTPKSSVAPSSSTIRPVDRSPDAILLARAPEAPPLSASLPSGVPQAVQWNYAEPTIDPTLQGAAASQRQQHPRMSPVQAMGQPPLSPSSTRGDAAQPLQRLPSLPSLKASGLLDVVADEPKRGASAVKGKGKTSWPTSPSRQPAFGVAGGIPAQGGFATPLPPYQAQAHETAPLQGARAMPAHSTAPPYAQAQVHSNGPGIPYSIQMRAQQQPGQQSQQYYTHGTSSLPYPQGYGVPQVSNNPRR